MIDLVSIRDHSAGERLQKFPWMVRVAGGLPVKEDDGMSPTQRPVSVWIIQFMMQSKLDLTR